MVSLLIGYGIASGIASGVVLALGVIRASRRSTASGLVTEQEAQVPRLQRSVA